MDQSRKPVAVRAIAYVGVAFVLFLAAEGLAHLSGRTDAGVATPAVAATFEMSDPMTGVSYLPSRITVQSDEPVGVAQEMAPTF